MTDAPLLAVTIPGKPRPQGSMQLSRDPRTGGEFAKYGAEVVMHRNLMVGVMLDAWKTRAAIGDVVAVQCLFRFKRPLAHYGTGRNADVMKALAPHYMGGRVDTDKLLRCVGDALTIAGVLEDDSLIVVMHGEKVWSDEHGTDIEVRQL